MIRATETGVGIGDRLAMFSDKWDGARVGFVSRTFGAAAPTASVNVLADGSSDQEYLEALRKSPSGNTLAVVTVHETVEGGMLAPTAEEIKQHGQEFDLGGFKLRVLALRLPNR